MKVKLKTPDHMILAFNMREQMILESCLEEACHGFLMDRFLPARRELMMMQDLMLNTHTPKHIFKFKPTLL